MSETRIDDFSAGLYEKVAPQDFTERQSAVIKGFVLPDQVSLRSQGAFQLISGAADIEAVWTFRGDDRPYLVMVNTAGVLHWMPAPTRTARFTETRAAAWTGLGAPQSTRYRATGTVRWFTGGAWTQGLLFHSFEGTAGAVVVYENPAGTGLSFDVVEQTIPSRVANAEGELEPSKGVMPRHNVAVQWKDFLILGDIQWNAADANNIAGGGRYPNYLWFADPTDPTKYDPRYPVRAAEEGTTIVGLEVVEDGLLVLTTTSNGQAGISLIRGTPSIPSGSTEAESPTYSVEVLFSGQGLTPGIGQRARTRLHAYWNAISSVVFVDALGLVQQVRSLRMGRIDTNGPTAPGIGTVLDSVFALGESLFVARSGRFLTLKSYGQEGAWTELNFPNGIPRSFAGSDDFLYFMAENRVWRYSAEDALPLERGQVDGTLVTLTYGTRTLGDPKDTYEKFWDHVTLTTSGGANARVTDVTVSGAGALVTTDDRFTTALALPTPMRFITTVNGHGPSRECSVTARFIGDVTIESLVLSWTPGSELQ